MTKTHIQNVYGSLTMELLEDRFFLTFSIFRWTAKGLSHTYTRIHYSQTPLPSRLPHDNEHISLCYIVGPCWFSILNIAVCNMLIPNSLSVLSSHRKLHFLKEEILQKTLCKRYTNDQHTF